MAEAEDVITDVARHATVYARELWRRHSRPASEAKRLLLSDVAERLGLLLQAVFDRPYPLRLAQMPPRPNLLSRMLKGVQPPHNPHALPATDGASIWLPKHFGDAPSDEAIEWFRVLALSQAMRATRGSVRVLMSNDNPQALLINDVYLALEANAADRALIRLLPGLAPSVHRLRALALSARPAVRDMPAALHALESFTRNLLAQSALPDAATHADFAACETAEEALTCAQRIAPTLMHETTAAKLRAGPLFKDLWTGQFRVSAVTPTSLAQAEPESDAPRRIARSAQLARRPEVRPEIEDEDDAQAGAWMIQASPPQEHVEDPLGMQRPTDRDEETAAEDFADSVSELPEARLVSSPSPAKEVLLSDDVPDARARRAGEAHVVDTQHHRYPEWDYRIKAYGSAGATVRVLPPLLGSLDWVERTLREHGATLHAIRRRFQMLRAERTRLHKQLDGEEYDLQAYLESRADYQAGLPLSDRLYQTLRPARRDMAIMLLIDVSGSTDSWISGQRRVIDVEREALLLVCAALEGLGEQYSVQAFSGEGPQGVTVRSIKRFDESYSDEVALRIAALEPEHYTRAGAALRHASALLLQQTARYRLLLLLSDGRPNDIDEYDGQYGVEDMRQAVTEAKLQGIFPFCLTIDRHAAAYLGGVFGARQYALLQRAELLPTVLLDWMKRLLSA